MILEENTYATLLANKPTSSQLKYMSREQENYTQVGQTFHQFSTTTDQ